MMGDRGNIVIPQGGEQAIYLYTHWGGEDLPLTLKAALQRGRGRWDDQPYLTRIIFSEMIKNEVLGETGYGISTYLTDNEHPLVVVDTETQTVRFDDHASWDFESYVHESDGTLLAAFSREPE